MEAFTFQAAEKVLSNSIVVGVTLARHALADAKSSEGQTVSGSSVLDAAVGVEDEAGTGLAAPDSHIESGEGKVCVDALGESIADDLLCAKVFHNGAVEPALISGDVGDVADPGGVGPVKGKTARKEIGRDGMRML